LAYEVVSSIYYYPSISTLYTENGIAVSQTKLERNLNKNRYPRGTLSHHLFVQSHVKL
jgi:hypothetical protein